MRALVVALALLAGLKIWTHQTLFRAASEQALLKAYKTGAVKACQHATARQRRVYAGSAVPVDWSQHRLAKVVIGNKDLDVALWQLEHKQWDARFKTPYIHLKSNTAPQSVVCVYDILAGTVTRLRS